MGRAGRERARQRGGEEYGRYGVRGGRDARWYPEDRYDDPRRDLRDLYEDLQGPAGDDLTWPEFEEESED